MAGTTEIYRIWAERLKDLKPARFTGLEDPTTKQREIDRFLSGDARLLLMSLRAGQGTDGLQKACATVVFGEMDWSPAAMEQCLGRVFRDGPEKPVFAY